MTGKRIATDATDEIVVTDEELDEIEAIIRQDLDSSREELHHTWHVEYKDRVKHHIEVMEHVVSLIGRSRGGQPANSSASQADRTAAQGLAWSSSA